MKNTHRRFWLSLFVCIIALAALALGPLSDAGVFKPDQRQETLPQEQTMMPAKHAALQDFEADTGARNAVAAVYLQYRLYDTLFEALLLLISVLGILYFLEEKSRDERENAQ